MSRSLRKLIGAPEKISLRKEDSLVSLAWQWIRSSSGITLDCSITSEILSDLTDNWDGLIEHTGEELLLICDKSFYPIVSDNTGTIRRLIELNIIPIRKMAGRIFLDTQNTIEPNTAGGMTMKLVINVQKDHVEKMERRIDG